MGKHVKMPCGWNCGAMLGNREMMEHFARCPSRPGVVVATVNLDASDAAVTRGRVLDYRETAQVDEPRELVPIDDL